MPEPTMNDAAAKDAARKALEAADTATKQATAVGMLNSAKAALGTAVSLPGRALKEAGSQSYLAAANGCKVANEYRISSKYRDDAWVPIKPGMNFTMVNLVAQQALKKDAQTFDAQTAGIITDKFKRPDSFEAQLKAKKPDVPPKSNDDRLISFADSTIKKCQTQMGVSISKDGKLQSKRLTDDKHPDLIAVVRKCSDDANKALSAYQDASKPGGNKAEAEKKLNEKMDELLKWAALCDQAGHFKPDGALYDQQFQEEIKDDPKFKEAKSKQSEYEAAAASSIKGETGGFLADMGQAAFEILKNLKMLLAPRLAELMKPHKELGSGQSDAANLEGGAALHVENAVEQVARGQEAIAQEEQEEQEEKEKHYDGPSAG